MYNFPKNAEYLFFALKLEEDFGGLTNAMFDRAKLFSNNIQESLIKVFTFTFNPDFNEINNLVSERLELNNKIKIYNIYEFYQREWNQDNILIGENYNLSDVGLNVEKVQGKNAFRYYKNGLYKMYKSFEKKNGKLKFIDFFNENRYRIRREEFDNSGVLKRIIYFDYITNKPKQELYYSPEGYCYVSKWYKNENEENKIDRIIHFDQHGEILHIFKSLLEFRRHWIEQVINKNKKNFAICDARPIDNVVLSLKDNNLFKIFVTHSIHIRAPFNYDSELRSGNRAVLNKISEPDAMVFLTNAQQDDIRQRYGNLNNFFTIPHAYNSASIDTVFEEKDLNKVVMLARYHKEKQLDHAIKAFNKVVQHIPEAKLELYGFGMEESNLVKLINDLNLTNNVYLKGVTNDPSRVFSNAAASLLTSKYEGFGLVILESLANGTPVISYNVKYGPEDMINHGQNGMLVEPDNIDQLSEFIIKLLSNKEKLKKMSNKAPNSINSFKQDAFLKRWSALFHKVIDQKQQKNKVSNMNFYLQKSKWLDIATGLYKLEGIMTLNGEYQNESLVDLRLIWKISNQSNDDIIYENVEHIERIEHNKWKLAHIFSLNDIYKNGPLSIGFWNISLLLQWNNTQVEKSVGYSKSPNVKIKDLKGLPYKNSVLKPNYTNKNGNLTFSVIKK